MDSVFPFTQLGFYYQMFFQFWVSLDYGRGFILGLFDKSVVEEGSQLEFREAALACAIKFARASEFEVKFG